METMDAVPPMGKGETVEDPGLKEVERPSRRKTDKERQRSTLGGGKVTAGGRGPPRLGTFFSYSFPTPEGTGRNSSLVNPTHRPTATRPSARKEHCITFECGMSPGRVTFARLPLKGAGSSQSGAVCCLVFRPPAGKEIFDLHVSANTSSQHTTASASEYLLFFSKSSSMHFNLA